MIEHGFDFRPEVFIPLELGAKKKNKKTKGQAWNNTNAGTSKARMGVQEALRSKSGKQNVKRA